MTSHAFPFLLLPHVWASRNRLRRRERGDVRRTILFGGVGVVVCGVLFQSAFWLASELASYDEFGDYLLRLGLSWMFMMFLGFLAFSGVVTALSMSFLSDELRLLMVAPVAPGRLFLARYTRTVIHASWMVVAFIVPLLGGVGVARGAPLSFYLTVAVVLAPFVVIPVAIGAAATLMLVNLFPARRARDLLMLLGLLIAAGLILMLRFIQPEQLLRVETLPDIADFFASLQSPITPMLPSFWAGEVLFASLRGGFDLLHAAALWTTALAFTVLVSTADARWHFSGYSRSQEAPKTRVSSLAVVDRVAALVPVPAIWRHLLVKDAKVFLRDVSQWVQLLPLVALVLLYLYNFSVIDLNRVPYMSGVIKNVYAFVNLGLAGFVLATVAARFVFPAVSVEGDAFWIVRTAPVSLRDFLWSKFWIGFVPIAVFTLGLTVAANELLTVDPVLKVVAAVGIVFMTFALVGLATGFGARYPRFGANPTQAAGSYGGIMFMVLAVFFILVMIALLGWASTLYLFRRARETPLGTGDQVLMAASFVAAGAISVATGLGGMRSGVRSLEAMSRE